MKSSHNRRFIWASSYEFNSTKKMDGNTLARIGQDLSATGASFELGSGAANSATLLAGGT